MIDIVERLRDYTYEHDTWPLQQEAADEIVRLRAERDALQALLDACKPYLKDEETPAQRIERERQDTHSVTNLYAKALNERDALHAALRKHTWRKFVSGGAVYVCCQLCTVSWKYGDPERHALGCLAAPKEKA